MEKKISRPSQERKILAYLQDHKSITGLEALKLFGCMRLPARIAVLEDRGHKITRHPVTVQNRYGQPVRVMSYGLEE